MNVEEFVKSTLTQIASAVASTNNEFAAMNMKASAVPSRKELRAGERRTFDTVPDTFDISFDIAVTVDSGQSDSLKVIGGDREPTSTVSRIQFAIPLKLPRGDY